MGADCRGHGPLTPQQLSLCSTPSSSRMSVQVARAYSLGDPRQPEGFGATIGGTAVITGVITDGTVATSPALPAAPVATSAPAARI